MATTKKQSKSKSGGGAKLARVETRRVRASAEPGPSAEVDEPGPSAVTDEPGASV